ncbi:hypothetical protein K492DRAFT_212118, partial [Lichtheimia hyalospora FSU 10163]
MLQMKFMFMILKKIIGWNKTRNRIFNDMWTYNVITKEWIQKDDIPFIWNGEPVTCEYENKIYFMGSQDG